MYSVFVHWDRGCVEEVTGLDREEATQIKRIYDKHKDVSNAQIGYDINTPEKQAFSPLSTGANT